MKEFEIGLQTGEDGPEYFGLDELNEALASGARITKIEPGDILVFEEETDDEAEPSKDEAAELEEEEGYILAGFSLKVQVEDA